jgi:uncharacterized protein (DUF1499 family)
MRILFRIGLWLGAGVMVLGVVSTAVLAIAARRVGAPATLGVRDGQLSACPPTPNCVSTQAVQSFQFLPPLLWSGSAEQALAGIQAIIALEPRAEIVVTQDNYLHAVFRSPTMAYPDDVEFYVDEAAGLIHFRSAARLGSGDAGVNRQRMQRLSALISARLGTPVP